MKKIILASWLTLSASALAFPNVGYTVEGGGHTYDHLSVDAKWLSLMVPAAGLQGRTPDAIQVSGLPDGVAIKLVKVSRENDQFKLELDVSREDDFQHVYSEARVLLLAGDQALTTLNVMVLGGASLPTDP